MAFQETEDTSPAATGNIPSTEPANVVEKVKQEIPSEDPEKAKKLYSNLIKDGYNVKNLGSEDDFLKAISERETSEKIYDGLIADGYNKNNLGEKDAFLNTFLKKNAILPPKDGGTELKKDLVPPTQSPSQSELQKEEKKPKPQMGLPASQDEGYLQTSEQWRYRDGLPTIDKGEPTDAVSLVLNANKSKGIVAKKMGTEQAVDVWFNKERQNQYEQKLKEIGVDDKEQQKITDELKGLPEDIYDRKYTADNGEVVQPYKKELLGQLREQNFPYYLGFINQIKNQVNLEKEDTNASNELGNAWSNSGMDNLDDFNNVEPDAVVSNLNKLNNYTTDATNIIADAGGKKTLGIETTDDSIRNVQDGAATYIASDAVTPDISKQYLVNKIGVDGLEHKNTAEAASTAIGATPASTDLDSYTLASIKSKLDPDNAVDQMVFNKYAQKVGVADAFQGATSVEDAAINYATSIDANLAAQKDMLGELPPEYKGKLVNDFLNSPTVMDYVKNDPELLAKYKDAKLNLNTNFPEWAKNNLSQKISTAYQKTYANAFANIPLPEDVNKIVDKLYSEGKINAQDVQTYKTQIAPDLGYFNSVVRGINPWSKPDIVTADLMGGLKAGVQSTIESGAKTIESGLKYTPAGFIVFPDEARMGKILADRTIAQVDRKGFAGTMYSVGEVTGFAATMGLLGVPIGALGITGEAAHIASTALVFYGKNREEALMEFPGKDLKTKIVQQAYTGLNTWVDLNLAKLLPIGKATENVKSLFKNETASILGKLKDGAITDAQAGQEIWSKLKSFGYKYAGNSMNTAATMNTFGTAHNVINNLFGISNNEVGQMTEEWVNSFIPTLKSVSLLSAVSSIKPGEKGLVGKTMWDMASNPEYYKKMIENQLGKNKDITDNKEELLGNLATASTIYNNLNDAAFGNLTEVQKQKYLLLSMQAKIYNEKAASIAATDPTASKVFSGKYDEITKQIDSLSKGKGTAADHAMPTTEVKKSDFEINDVPVTEKEWVAAIKNTPNEGFAYNGEDDQYHKMLRDIGGVTKITEWDEYEAQIPEVKKEVDQLLFTIKGGGKAAKLAQEQLDSLKSDPQQYFTDSNQTDIATKLTDYDNKKQAGTPSGVGVGKKTVAAKLVDGGSEEEITPSGVLQTPGVEGKGEATGKVVTVPTQKKVQIVSPEQTELTPEEADIEKRRKEEEVDFQMQGKNFYAKKYGIEVNTPGFIPEVYKLINAKYDAELKTLKEKQQAELPQQKLEEGVTVELPAQIKGGSPRQMVYKEGEWQQQVGGQVTSVGGNVQTQAQAQWESKPAVTTPAATTTTTPASVTTRATTPAPVVTTTTTAATPEFTQVDKHTYSDGKTTTYIVPTSSSESEGTHIEITKPVYDEWKKVDEQEKKRIERIKNSNNSESRKNADLKANAMSAAAEKRKILGTHTINEQAKITSDVNKIQLGDNININDVNYTVQGFPYGKIKLSTEGANVKGDITVDRSDSIVTKIIEEKKKSAPKVEPKGTLISDVQQHLKEKTVSLETRTKKNEQQLTTNDEGKGSVTKPVIGGKTTTGEQRPDNIESYSNPDGSPQYVVTRSDRGGRGGLDVVVGKVKTKAKAIYKQSAQLLSSIRKYRDSYCDDTLIELDDPKLFHSLIEVAKKENKYGACVHVYTPEEYSGMRLFITPDGKAGVALKPDGDLVSGFSCKEKDKPLRIAQLLTLAIKSGAKKADSFDTVLPQYYLDFGLLPVAQDKWNEQFKPERWDKRIFKKWNKGEPDVIYYAYKGGDRSTIEQRIGTFGLWGDVKKSVPYKEYDGAVEIQQKAISEGESLPVKKAEVPEPTKEQTSKDLANKIRALKIGKGYTFILPDLGITKAIYDKALDFLANQVEKGTPFGKAIENTINWVDGQVKNAKWDKELFKRNSISIATQNLVVPGEIQPAMIITGAKGGEKYDKYNGSTSIEALRTASPKMYINRAIELAKSHLVAGEKELNPNASDEDKLKWADNVYLKAKNTVVSNLLFIYNNIPESVRAISKLWYDGANKIAQDFSKKYKVTLEQSAAIIATLSPQKPWFDNLHLAHFMMDFDFNNQNKLLTNEAYEYYKLTGADYPAQVLHFPELKKMIGKKYHELSNYDKSVLIRYEFDNKYDRRAPTRLPTGHIIGKEKSLSSFSGYDKMANAVSIMSDGSAKNISNNIGSDSKVRNFYTNIVNPNSADHATIDTHAIAAGYLLPLGSKSPQVQFDFATYSFFFDAYKEAAKIKGVLPREMQSIVWEGVKSLFPPSFKNEKNKQELLELWHKYKNGTIDINTIQNYIKQNGKDLSKTDWSGHINSSIEPGQTGGYINELPLISRDKNTLGQGISGGAKGEVSSVGEGYRKPIGIETPAVTELPQQKGVGVGEKKGIIINPKERTEWKGYEVGDIIDGNKLDDLSGNLVGNKPKEKFILVQTPLSEFTDNRKELLSLEKGYEQEEIYRLESMKSNFEKTPPIPDEGDGMHRIIVAKELGHETILQWKNVKDVKQAELPQQKGVDVGEEARETIRYNYEDSFGFNDFDWNEESKRENFKEWLSDFEKKQFNKNLPKVIKEVKEDIALLKEKELSNAKLKDFEELIIPTLGNSVLVPILSEFEASVLFDPNATVESIEKGFREAKNIIDEDGSLNMSKINSSKLSDLLNEDRGISLPAFKDFVEKNPDYKGVFDAWKKVLDKNIELTLKETNAFRSPSIKELENLYKELTKLKGTSEAPTTIKEKGKKAADTLRKAKIKLGGGGLQSNIAGIPIALYNAVIDTIALAMEGGASLAQAISHAIEKHKLGDIKEFNKDRLKSILDDVINGKETPSGVKKAITTPLREVLGLPAVQLPKMGTDIEELEQAKQRIDNGDVNPISIVNDIIKNNRTYKDEKEVFDMQYYAHQLDVKNKELSTKIAEADTDIEKAEFLGQKQQLIDLIDKQTNAARIAGNKMGKAFRSMRPVIDSGFNISNERGDIIDAYAGEVPPEIMDKLNAITQERDAAIAQRDKVEKDLNDLKAQKEIDKAKKATESENKGKPKKTKEDYTKERKSIVDKIKDKWKNAKGNNTYSVILPIPITKIKQLAAISPEVGLLLKSHVEEGVDKINDIVDSIHNLLQSEIPGLTKKDIINLIAGKYAISKEKSDAAKKVLELRKEARQLVKEGETPNEKEQAEIDRLNQKADRIEAKIQAGDTDTEVKDKLNMFNNEEWIKADQRVANAEKKIRDIKKNALESKQNFIQKTLMWAGRATRLSVLSGMNVLVKLAAATVIGGAAKRIPEQLAGVFYNSIFSKLAAKAPIEGSSMNLTSELKWYKDFFNPKKFVSNAWEILKTGSSYINKKMGKQEHEHIPGLYMMVDLHQIIKDPAKRATFEASFDNGMKWAAKQGYDIQNPLIINSIENMAFKRAEYEIFQESNSLTRKFTSWKNGLEAQGNLGHTYKFLVDFLIPISSVPTNIARRVAVTSPLGLLGAYGKVANAYRKGIEDLKPEEADAVMRQLKQGSLGTALWLIGWFGYASYGGLYTKFNPNKKRDDDEMASDVMVINGEEIPKPVQHALPLEVIQTAATARRIWEMYTERDIKNQESNTFSNIYKTALSTIGAVGEQIPVLETPIHVGMAFSDPYEAEKLKEDMMGRVQPQILKETGIIEKESKKKEMYTEEHILSNNSLAYLKENKIDIPAMKPRIQIKVPINGDNEGVMSPEQYDQYTTTVSNTFESELEKYLDESTTQKDKNELGQVYSVTAGIKNKDLVNYKLNGENVLQAKIKELKAAIEAVVKEQMFGKRKSTTEFSSDIKQNIKIIN